VLAALGWEAYDDLMATIPPVVSDRLTVVGADAPPACPPAKRRPAPPADGSQIWIRLLRSPLPHEKRATLPAREQRRP